MAEPIGGTVTTSTGQVIVVAVHLYEIAARPGMARGEWGGAFTVPIADGRAIVASARCHLALSDGRAGDITVLHRSERGTMRIQFDGVGELM